MQSRWANQVENIYFKLSEARQDLLKESALQEAVKDAESSAKIAAGLLNVEILSGLTYPPVPVKTRFTEAETPIFPGETQFTVTIDVTYIIR